MAVAQFYAWDRLGRPLTPAQPIREFVGKMKVAYPRAAGTFSWYADDAHYEANFPEDHTPYSYTGWPLQNPQWWVCATDVMHRPALGVDCDVLFPYWLTEAKAGRMPWLKYMIWQARLYSVRNNWQPQANSGHFDHVHLSTRTDHLTTSLGSWSPSPEDDMTPEQSRIFANIANTISGWAGGLDAVNFIYPDGSVKSGRIDGLYNAVAARVESGGGDGLTHDELVQAAFEGAQRAEGE